MNKLILTIVAMFTLSVSVFAQKTVTGTVTAASDGFGIPGVNVIVKGTTIGVATDIDGNFTLEVPDENVIIQFSAIGMKTVEKKWEGGSF